MNKLQKSLIPIIFATMPITVSVIISYLSGQLPPIPKFTHGNKILFASLVLFIIVAAVLAYWQDKQQQKDTRVKIQPKVRLQLLKAEAIKVNKRLQDSLHRLLTIELMREEQPQHVGRSPLQTLYTISVNNISQPQTSDRIIEVLRRNDIAGRLLILGKPGSGKTTTLLDLAKELLEKATQTDSEPIPIIFELSAWRNDIVSIFDWLIAQLKQQYNLAPEISRSWLKQGKILPLLDGLDELGLKRQRNCIQAINQYLTEYAAQDLVVCCREEEYIAGKKQLSNLNGALCLQPLTDLQIHGYLQQLHREDLWKSIQNNIDFFELARTPLLLSMMVVAYQGRTIQTKEELFDAYIERRLELLPVRKGEQPRKQIMHFLVFLAIRLQGTQTEFLVENMQPSWFQSRQQRVIYGITIGLIGGIIINLFFWPNGDLISVLIIRIIGIIIGITLGLLSGKDSIERVETIIFPTVSKSFKIFIIQMKEGLKGGLISGLIVWLISRLIIWLLYGLIFGLIFGLIRGLIFGLIGGEIVNKSIPNQGIRASAKNTVVLTLLLFSLISIFGQICLNLLPPELVKHRTIILTIFQILIVIFTSMWGGGLACIQHFALRLVLWRSGDIPWNYAQFLNRAAERRIIQQVGGRYRFIHRLLLDHFADMRV